MIRTVAIAAFALALASAAQAMPFGIHQRDAMFTQVREGCGPDMIMAASVYLVPGIKFAKLGAARDGTEAFALTGTN